MLDQPDELRFLASELERVEAQLAPTDQFEAINQALADVLTLTAGSMDEAQCKRWLEVALTTLADEPTEALAAALAEAKRRCKWANEVVPFVVARCEEWKAPLRRHLNVLRIVAEATDVG